MSENINVNARKAANISYSLNAVRKTLSVPLVTEGFVFGSGMTDPVWEQAVWAEDFERFGNRNQDLPLKKSRMAVFRTAEELVVGWFFFDVKEERLYPPENAEKVSVWNGDLAELHFGSMGPDPWTLQLCLGITGLCFDSSGAYDWNYHLFEDENGWGAELKLSAENLLLTEGGMLFNLCRCSRKHFDSYCWSPLYKRFHEVEDFGELLFADYNTAAALRCGKAPAGKLDRNGFEELRRSWEVPAWQVIHGPYLSCPGQDSLCISWETAGRLPAFLEYKVKGSAEAPRRMFCSRSNGILASETAHFVQLTELEADTLYEYELFYLSPVLDEPRSSGIKRCFRTAPAPEKDFSFFCVTDLHSDANHLVNALSSPEAQQSSFHLLLGDNLSHAAGREALYRGIIDPIVSVNQAAERDIPLVFVRGNHEQLGVFANEYFTVMRHPSGRTWYAFRYGKVFFVILDSGNDKADREDQLLLVNNPMLAAEKEFLEKTVQSQAWKEAAFRIGFIHIPPLLKMDVQTVCLEPFASAEIKLDVLFSGHWHDYIRIDRNASVLSPESSAFLRGRIPEVEALPYPRIALATDNALCCRVTDEQLELEILRFTQEGEKSLQDKIFLFPQD